MLSMPLKICATMRWKTRKPTVNFWCPCRGQQSTLKNKKSNSFCSSNGTSFGQCRSAIFPIQPTARRTTNVWQSTPRIGTITAPRTRFLPLKTIGANCLRAEYLKPSPRRNPMRQRHRRALMPRPRTKQRMKSWRNCRSCTMLSQISVSRTISTRSDLRTGWERTSPNLIFHQNFSRSWFNGRQET